MARHATPKKEKRQGAPGWAWLLAGLAVGLFVAFLVYLQGQKDPEHKLPPIPSRNEPAPPRPAAETGGKTGETEAKPAKPRFDFYTILPEMEVPVPEPEPSKRPSSRPPSRTQAPLAEGQRKSEPRTTYVLQLGSFRNRADADRLKAKISLLGFEPHIQTVNIDGSDWYRVRIGPYSNSVRIAEVRHRLREAELDAILLKLKE